MRSLFQLAIFLSLIAGSFAAGVYFSGDRLTVDSLGNFFESDLESHVGVLVPLEVESENGVYAFNVAIADEDDERHRGLQIVDDLGKTEGMWFVFEEEGLRTFWMKDMSIPLDILFVDTNFEVVSFVEEAPPCADVDETQADCPRYASVTPAQYVLELAAGSVERFGLGVGNRISILNDAT